MKMQKNYSWGHKVATKQKMNAYNKCNVIYLLVLQYQPVNYNKINQPMVLFNDFSQKQPSRGVHRKRCYRKYVANLQTPMSKCEHTSTWVFSCKFAAYFLGQLLLRTPMEGCFCSPVVQINCCQLPLNLFHTTGLFPHSLLALVTIMFRVDYALAVADFAPLQQLFNIDESVTRLIVLFCTLLYFPLRHLCPKATMETPQKCLKSVQS